MVTKLIHVFAVILIISSFAHATTITLNQINRGWVNELGVCSGHCPLPNGNYFTGVTGGLTYRSFYVFDLSDLNEIITAVEFQFSRNSLSAEYGLFDFTGNISDFDSADYDGGEPGLSNFNDLGAGTSYGEFVFNDNSGVYDELAFASFNANGVAALNNARGGKFAFGASILASGYLGSGSGGASHVTQLVLSTSTISNAVPAPASLWIFGLTLLGVSTLSHKKWFTKWV